MNRARAEAPKGTSGLVGLTVVAAVAGTAAYALTRRGPKNGAKRRPDMPTIAGGRGLHVERTVTVRRSPDELYRVWRDLARLPELMPHLRSVTPLDERRSRWVACAPGGATVEWEAEIVADEPGRLIAWRSVEGSDVDNGGSVRFTTAPADRGAEVKVRLTYAPPAGRIGGAVAALLGRDADREVREDLRRFKQRIETGEVATAGTGAGRS